MDLDYMHFIRTIKAGLEIKVSNIDSHSRPSLAFKTLTDIYKTEDAKSVKRPRIIDHHRTYGGSLFDLGKHKGEIPHLKRADRKLREIKPETEDFLPCSENDSGSDLDDGITLEQLRKGFKESKRKLSSSSVSSNQADAGELIVKDESDLNVPLMKLKKKFKRKTDKELVIKSEQNVLVSEPFQQVSGELAPSIYVKVEAQEDYQQLGCLATTLADHPSIEHNKIPSSWGITANRFSKMIELENSEPSSLKEGCQNCVTNEISYSHVEDVDPINVLVPFDRKNFELDDLNLQCPEIIVLPPREKEKEIRMTTRTSKYSFCDHQNSNVLCQANVEEILFPSDSSAIQMSDMNGAADSCFNGFNHVVDLYRSTDGAESGLLHDQHELLNCQDSYPDYKDNDGVSGDARSSSERYVHPEKLLSIQKAISPSSREKLWKATDSIDIFNDVKKCSPGLAGQRKIVTSPEQIIKKSKSSRRNLEGPRFSRSLPSLNTGCGSVKGCSESAIAFSLRQMHDMESLAGKLMTELKSLRDIVQQKLLFEAYRSASLKNETDEVKSAIENATKAEETATKWLNMMSRDCNRFCKIMKLTPNSIDTYIDAGPRLGKKIKFADEAGRNLCHVKFFDHRSTSPVNDSVKL